MSSEKRQQSGFEDVGPAKDSGGAEERQSEEGVLVKKYAFGFKGKLAAVLAAGAMFGSCDNFDKKFDDEPSAHVDDVEALPLVNVRNLSVGSRPGNPTFSLRGFADNSGRIPFSVQRQGVEISEGNVSIGAEGYFEENVAVGDNLKEGDILHVAGFSIQVISQIPR